MDLGCLAVANDRSKDAPDKVVARARVARSPHGLLQLATQLQQTSSSCPCCLPRMLVEACNDILVAKWGRLRWSSALLTLALALARCLRRDELIACHSSSAPCLATGRPIRVCQETQSTEVRSGRPSDDWNGIGFGMKEGCGSQAYRRVRPCSSSPTPHRKWCMCSGFTAFSSTSTI